MPDDVPPITIQLPSVQSLLLAVNALAKRVSTETGFVVMSDETSFLITNWHVVSGRNLETGKILDPNGAIPDSLTIWHNAEAQLGAWVEKREPLMDVDGPLWLELPNVSGQRVDVVALRLNDLTGVQLYPHDLEEPPPNRRVAIGPTEQVSIIGFPFGLTGGGLLAIWVQGTLASEPDIDFMGLPVQLVDSRTREGQSGSPVIAYRSGGATTIEGGGTMISGKM